VTTDAWQRRSLFQLAEVGEIVIARLLSYREQGAYLLHEFVLMPNHLHLLLTPGMTTSLERAMQLIKGGSSRQIHQQRGHKMEIWQPGFHDWTVRDAEDYKARAEYIRMNPIRARLAARPEDWPYGSAGRRFKLDPMPQRFKARISGAEAPAAG